jgi:hypothetical protein
MSPRDDDGRHWSTGAAAGILPAVHRQVTGGFTLLLLTAAWITFVRSEATA